jgi:hypothetical protein
MKNIKNLLVVCILSIVLIPTALGQVQFSKDTLAVDGNKVGYISNVVIEEKTIINSQGREQTGPVTEYTVTLFKPITLIQKSNLEGQLNPVPVNYIKVEFKEDFTSIAKNDNAGLLLIDAANLKNARNNTFLASSLLSATGTLLQLSGNEIGLSPTTISYIPLVTLSASLILTIRGIILDYEANQKLRDAGVAIQNQQLTIK